MFGRNGLPVRAVLKLVNFLNMGSWISVELEQLKNDFLRPGSSIGILTERTLIFVTYRQ